MFASGSRAFLDYLFNNFILLFLHWNALVVAYHYSSSSKSWVLRIDFFFIVCYQVISSFQGSGLARVWTIMVWVRSFLCWIFNANVSDYIPVFKKFPFVSNFAWVECILSLHLLQILVICITVRGLIGYFVKRFEGWIIIRGSTYDTENWIGTITHFFILW